MPTDKDIPREVALKLCDEIRAENKRKWFYLETSMLGLLQVGQGRRGKDVYIQQARLQSGEQTI